MECCKLHISSNGPSNVIARLTLMKFEYIQNSSSKHPKKSEMKKIFPRLKPYEYIDRTNDNQQMESQ